MNITGKENQLFNRWKTKPGRTPFILDGSPSPNDYLSSNVKIAIMLKDANLGKYRESEFDLRNYLYQSPDSWWRKIAAWCYVLKDINSSEPNWIGLDQIELIENLKSFVFIQLKKRSGYGSVSHKVLLKIAQEDKLEIIEQIQIYDPQIIVCGGVGIILSSLFGCDDYQITPKSIGYWIAKIDGKSIYLIDYCHPSIRASNKIIPAIAYGLRDACIYLMEKEDLYI